MQCPECSCQRISVVTTAYADSGKIVRRRHCHGCDHRWYTLQGPEELLPAGTFRWIEKAGRRRAVKLLEAGVE
ncbi:hypothetical protein EBT31_08335 [bacterium]|jgi:transcriptional regulator NrdR family protein|nr:hypothetical protein [bacterium]